MDLAISCHRKGQLLGKAIELERSIIICHKRLTQDANDLIATSSLHGMVSKGVTNIRKKKNMSSFAAKIEIGSKHSKTFRMPLFLNKTLQRKK